jgi:hypothetical protein
VQSDSNVLWNQDRDSNNLRAWNNVQRFGFNFLYPRDRYVQGFQSPLITDRFGNQVLNPLFAKGRTPDHVLFAAIVGVPDHLIPKEVDAETGLQVPLAGNNWAPSDWDAVVGPLGTRDPHMIESIGERNSSAHGMATQMAAWGYGATQGIAEYKGYNATAGAADLSADPPTGQTIVQPSTGLTVPYNGNGGERHMVNLVAGSSDNNPSDGDFDTLQYACIAPRSTKTASYDCSGSLTWAWNPLCDCQGADCAAAAGANTNWGNATANVTQPYYLGQPGLRYLRLVQALGASGYAASICTSSFEPAIYGIVKQLKSVLAFQCFAGSVQTLPDGSSNCIIVETIPQAAVKPPVGPIAAGTAGIPSPGACEALGLCTPGALGCNRSTQSSFAPNQPAPQAASQITLSVQTPGVGLQQVTAEMDPGNSGNVIIQPSTDAGEAAPMLVCEVPQLAGADLTDCMTKPDFTLTDAKAGWCYANDAAALANYGCAAGTGELRFLGAVSTQGAGSELYTVCITQIGGTSAATGNADTTPAIDTGAGG